MRTTILKSGLGILALAGIVTMALMSFTVVEEENYGGTASVQVVVDFGSSPDTYAALLNQGVKDGDTRIIEVSTDCYHDSLAAAQKALQQEIEYEMESYEKLNTSITYYVSDCE